MFERYTEKARRAVFFAHYEASHYGSPEIDTEHILLGLLREDKALSNRFLRPGASESIRKQIDGHITWRERIPTSVDLPLSENAKKVVVHSGETADELGHRYIGTEHLLLGLLRMENCFAAERLRKQGAELTKVREAVAKMESLRPLATPIRVHPHQPQWIDFHGASGMPPLYSNSSADIVSTLGTGRRKSGHHKMW
jgi:ATP-dependent Clp protease ATP-binding subunit ClpC